MGSCATPKSSYYFKTLQKDTTITGFVNNNFESKIRKADMLAINVTSLSAAEDQIFNQAATSVASATQAGYMVKEDGTVLLHRLGNVQVEGLTRRELSEKLQKDLLPFMKEPIVNVNYLNHKVTVLGEVGGPSIINMPGEQMPLIDILVMSGDIKETGKRDHVMIIREKDNEKQVKHVNLEDHSIFTSPWYYVQPNDIIYVIADEEKKRKEEKIAVIQKNIGFITAGLSFLFLIINIITR